MQDRARPVRDEPERAVCPEKDEESDDDNRSRGVAPAGAGPGRRMEGTAARCCTRLSAHLLLSKAFSSPRCPSLWTVSSHIRNETCKQVEAEKHAAQHPEGAAGLREGPSILAQALRMGMGALRCRCRDQASSYSELLPLSPPTVQGGFRHIAPSPSWATENNLTPPKPGGPQLSSSLL